jgi:hypothetical protein
MRRAAANKKDAAASRSSPRDKKSRYTVSPPIFQNRSSARRLLPTGLASLLSAYMDRSTNSFLHL